MKFILSKLILVLTLFLTACFPKKERFFFVDNYSDTTFIENPTFDTLGLTAISSSKLQGEKRIIGQITIFTNAESKPPPPPDGIIHYFMTPEFGIVYSQNTYWENCRQLHSTDEIIEKKIKVYVNFIKSNIIKDNLTN